MGFFAPSYRRRAGATGPAPTLTTYYRTAVPTSGAVEAAVANAITVVGTDFASGASLGVEIDGVVYSAAFTSSTMLTFTTSTSIAKGVYSFRVRNGDGQFSGYISGGIRFVASTAARSLSLWVEQGRGSDYAPAGSPPYTSLASAGASGGRTLTAPAGPFSLPTTGAAIDSTNQVRFGTDLKDLKSALTLGNFVSGSAFTIAMLVKLDASVAAWTGTSSGTMLW